eukprot:1188194-Prorocentrum_minimum.AAC.2
MTCDTCRGGQKRTHSHCHHLSDNALVGLVSHSPALRRNRPQTTGGRIGGRLEFSSGGVA